MVGPNGSGKSNISDAIRWVLARQAPSSRSGGGKMENVIFGGTQQRGARGFTSVSLVVDNTDRRIDVDNDEVTIGRKYTARRQRIFRKRAERAPVATSMSCSSTRARAATAIPSSGRAASQRSWAQNQTSAGKFFEKRPASPNTATAK